MDNPSSLGVETPDTHSDELSTSEQTAHALDLKTQEQMMQSIVDIFQLDEDPVIENEGWEEETAENLEERHQRTERLRMALPILQQLSWPGSELMPAVTEKLADGSRCIKWRGPIGDAGILDFFLHMLNTQEVQHSLMVHILRLIGNSCADTDENRERVISKNCIPSIMRQLQNSLLLPFAIPVLFNVCVDYEPAQKQASEARLSTELIGLISSPRFFESRAFIGYVCKLFDLLISQPSEPDIAPENTPMLLLTMAIDQSFQPDLEDFMALTNSGIAYLKHERFQQSFINHPSGLSTILSMLSNSSTRFGTSNNYNVPNFVVIDMDDGMLLSQMRFRLTSVLSDISALQSFSATYPLTSPVANTLIQLVSTNTKSVQSNLQLVTAACIILGNLARTDVACETLVRTYSIHLPLIAILSSASRSVIDSTPTSSEQTQLSYAVLGLLRNLAIPASNKQYLGDAGILESPILPRIWSLDTSPQIQYTAVNLTRQIVTGSLPNITRLCEPLSSDPHSPASGKSSLHILLSLHKRSDDAATKTEISRMVTTLCRVLHTNISSQSNENLSGTDIESITSLRQKFYDMHSDELCEPLCYLITQGQKPIFTFTSSTSSKSPKYPALRSEGWFVFALMARTPEGSQVIAECMHDADIFGLVCESLSGRRWDAGNDFSSRAIDDADGENTGEQEGASIPLTAESPEAVGNDEEKKKAADRSNLLVMVSELLKHNGDQMASFRKEIFEELVRVGGKDVSSETKVLHMHY